MSRSAFALGFALLLPLMAGAGAAAGPGAFDSLKAFARAVGMKKGGWQTRVKVTSAEIKSASDPAHLAEVRAEIEKQVGQVEEKDECSGTSPEGNPRLPGIVLEPGCFFSRLKAADGRWALSCAFSRNGEAAAMDSEGTYSRKAVTGRHEGDITRKGVVIHVKAETESRYVGKCRSPRPYELSWTSD